MGLKKGHTNNLNGRPKGKGNKVTADLRERMVVFLDGEFDIIQKKLKKLTPKDRVKAFVDLLPYALPRLQAVDVNMEFAGLNDEQLDQLYKRIMTGSLNSIIKDFTNEQQEG